jgi:hypothetical protein
MIDRQHQHVADGHLASIPKEVVQRFRDRSLHQTSIGTTPALIACDATASKTASMEGWGVRAVAGNSCLAASSV